MFVEEPDDHAHQNGGHDGSFPDAGEAVQQEKRTGEADADERAVHAGFHGSEFPFEEFDERQVHAFRRQQDGVRLDLHEDSEAQNDAAQQADYCGPGVPRRFQRRYQPHGEVRQHAEDEDHGDLEQVDGPELPFEQGRLHGDKAQVHEDGDAPHAQREGQAEDIGRAGDGGDPQAGLGGQGDAQGHDEEGRHQDEAAQDVFSNASPYVIVCHGTGC